VSVEAHRRGKASFLYNLPDTDVVVARTDGGEMNEPYDATWVRESSTDTSSNSSSSSSASFAGIEDSDVLTIGSGRGDSSSSTSIVDEGLDGNCTTEEGTLTGKEYVVSTESSKIISPV